MKRKKVRRLTPKQIAEFKNSTFFAEKKKEAQVAFNSPQFLAHARKRARLRRAKQASVPVKR